MRRIVSYLSALFSSFRGYSGNFLPCKVYLYFRVVSSLVLDDEERAYEIDVNHIYPNSESLSL